MESVELKSVQSRFFDSNQSKSQINTSQIEINTSNQSIPTEEDPNIFDKTNFNSNFLDKFLSSTSSIKEESKVVERIVILINNVHLSFKEKINTGMITERTLKYKKRTQPLLSKDTSSFLTKLINKKLLYANFELKKYCELILLFEDIAELTTDKEIFISFLNSVLLLIKEINNPSETFILSKRLSNFVMKVTDYHSSDKTFQDLVKQSITSLTIEETTIQNGINNVSLLN